MEINKLTPSEWYDIVRGTITAIDHSTKLVKETKDWRALYRDYIKPTKNESSLKGMVEYFDVNPYQNGYETKLCCSVNNTFTSNEIKISTKSPINHNDPVLKIKHYKVAITNFDDNGDGAVFISLNDDGSYAVTISRRTEASKFGSSAISTGGYITGVILSKDDKEGRTTDVLFDFININPDSELNHLLKKTLTSYEEEINKLLVIYDKCLINKRLDNIRKLINDVSGEYQKPSQEEIDKSFIDKSSL